jgi:hypothetical protein
LGCMAIHFLFLGQGPKKVCYITQTDLKHKILLPQHPEYWDFECEAILPNLFLISFWVFGTLLLCNPDWSRLVDSPWILSPCMLRLQVCTTPLSLVCSLSSSLRYDIRLFIVDLSSYLI